MRRIITLIQWLVLFLFRYSGGEILPVKPWYIQGPEIPESQLWIRVTDHRSPLGNTSLSI